MKRKYNAASLAVLCALIAGHTSAASAPDTESRRGRECEQVILFGNGSQTWVWNGENWRQKFPAVSPLAGDAMAYDKARREVVLFGRDADNASATWVWNGRDWRQKFPADSPAPGFLSPMMAYDSFHREVIMIGGSFTDGTETWAWDGENWRQKFPLNSPTFRIDYGAIAYDAATRKVVLFGGTEFGAHLSTSETWEWDGSSWEETMLPVFPDGTVGGFSAAYDAARREAVLFGRSPAASGVVPVTWGWHSSGWEQEFPQSSPPTDGGPMAYDAHDRKTVLLVPMFPSASQTWVWNGSQWKQRFPSTEPPAAFTQRWLMSSDVVTKACSCRRGNSLEAQEPTDSELQ